MELLKISMILDSKACQIQIREIDNVSETANSYFFKTSHCNRSKRVPKTHLLSVTYPSFDYRDIYATVLCLPVDKEKAIVDLHNHMQQAILKSIENHKREVEKLLVMLPNMDSAITTIQSYYD